ncbi:MAG: dihydroorotate dehydrogenase electron transfer subunit [Clostridiales bacterium]|nr:dihydroorotate dehydrogenase electron transfer subunit [Clostridiales bacterium]
MRLLGNTDDIWAPGQFVNIKIDGFFLRRPISVCSYSQGQLTLLYKVFGAGTKKLSQMVPNETLDLLVGLGNGFDTDPAQGKKVVLVGGGVGVPPLYGLAEALLEEGVTDLQLVMGFEGKDDVFYQEEFETLGVKVFVCTKDGAEGTKGLVTDILSTLSYDYYYTCGPMGMLKAVHSLGKEGQLSFEERMGCGFGACMGCTCQTITGGKRICIEGPVLESGEVLL